MRWDVIPKFIPVIFEGVKITLLVSALGILFGTIIGCIVGLVRSQKPKHPLLRIIYWLFTLYVEVVRGTPFLVQLYLMYYGPTFLFNIDLPGLTAGIIALSLNSGAYVAEIARGSIESIDRGQMEAGRSLGLSFGQTMWYIILPQALRRALPPLANEFASLIKESSVISVLGIADIMFKSKTVGTAHFAVFPALLVAAMYYLILTGITSQLVKVLERRMGKSDSR
ncbi:MAG: amino acid ABC transporter permease [Symbiobacterium sp.]|uniref:amino acid ABC transporter permease n=1 Tax=Symbiobacterium sp. TaxID=1971213 RepID=UPI0034642605